MELCVIILIMCLNLILCIKQKNRNDMFFYIFDFQSSFYFKYQKVYVVYSKNSILVECFDS